MRRYPVLLLFAINAAGLAVSWLAGARLGWLAAAGLYVITIGALIAIVAVLARLPGRRAGPQ
jgi:hypothetical protein